MRTKVLGLLFVAASLLDSSAGWFTSKETKAFPKYRDAARAAVKQQEFGLARTNYLAAHAALAKKQFRNFNYKDALAEMADFFLRHGQAHLGEPYSRELLYYYVKRKGTNHLDTAAAYFLHGQIQGELFRFAEAEQSLRRAQVVVQNRYGRHSPAAGYVASELGKTWLWAENERADRMIRWAMNLLADAHMVGEPPPDEKTVLRSRLHPNLEQVVGGYADYVMLLLINVHKKEIERVLRNSLPALLKGESAGELMIIFLQRLAYAFEARDLPEGVKLFLGMSANLLGEAEGFSRDQQLRLKESILDYYVRQEMDEPAIELEAELFDAGRSEDYLHDLNVRSEALRRARIGDKEQ